MAMWKLGKFWLILIGVAALLLALAVACGDEEEEGTPTATPTAAETGTPTPGGVTPTPAGEEQGITDTEIILGTHFALTGTYGAAYSPVLAGMKAYFKYVNEEEGGVCNRKIVFKVEDDQYQAAPAVEAVRKLLERDKVFAIIGGLGTAAHSAVWDELNEKGVPDLWIMTGAHKWAADPEAHPWSVAILPDYYVAGTVTGKYISENMPGKKVGILYQNDDFGKDHLTGLKNGLDPAKNELVSEQPYEITAISVRSQIANLKGDGAEVVFGACTPAPCAELVREAHRLGWEPQFFVTYVDSDPMMFQYASPELMEGVISLQAMKLIDWTDDPAVAEHHRIMGKYGDAVPGTFTMIGAGAAQFTVMALRATCENLTRQGLMDAVHTIFRDYQPDFTLPGVIMNLSPTDHLAFEAMRMLRATIDETTGKGKWEYFGDIISFAD
ncbi:MAG: ABC transporter substrate-binding protein [Dehalococcoidia bacterium]